MALDGIFLRFIRNEIEQETGAHADKIYQPSKDALVFLLRGKNGVKRLFISAAPGRCRINFTENKTENPENPPMFCMLLRKYLGAGRIVNAECDGNERVLTITFSATDEMGDVTHIKLVCECINSRPNIILVNEAGKILAAVRYSDFSEDERIIAAGATYTPPKEQGKLCLIDETADTLTKAVLSFDRLPLGKAILSAIGGLSPANAFELAFRVCGDADRTVNELTDADRMNLVGCINTLKKEIATGASPTVLVDREGNPVDFTFTVPNGTAGLYTAKPTPTYSAALDLFYQKKEAAARIRKESEDIFKLVGNLYSRTVKKLAARKHDIEKCKNREQWRIYGELIKANLYRLKSGMPSFEAENFYDEALSAITIPLNPALSPAANADRYFKEYKKSYTTEKMLSELMAEDEKDLVYFDSVLDALSRAENRADLAEIREELNAVGLLRRPKTAKRPQKQSDAFRKFTSPEGYTVLVGRNNRQNDLLTLSRAAKNDLWFHTKGLPGSHTIVLCGGKNVSEETVLFAAGLAAYFSKGQHSSNIPVDYTPVKFVKKPAGAKPGMVVYSTHKTVYVTPVKEISAE